MKDVNDLFFELIQVSVGTRICLSRVPSESEWGELYAMAQKQSLLGVCFAGVQKTLINSSFHSTCSGQVLGEDWNMQEHLHLQWMAMAAKIQQRNEVLNRQCVELQKRQDDGKCKSCILKGQGVANVYNEEIRNLRQSGDIDIWIDGSVNDVLACAKKYGKVGEVDIHHAHVEIFQNTDVEMHFTPAVLSNMRANKRLQTYFTKHKDSCFENAVSLSSGVITIPTVEFNMVYLLVHMYHHLFTEGLGLRQVMDYYFVLKDFSNHPIKYESLYLTKEIIYSLGLEKFTCALMWVIEHVFGVCLMEGLWESNKRDGMFLLEEIMKSGNFGKMSEDFILAKPKIVRPFYKLARNFHYRRFGRMEWAWGFISSIYWSYWKTITLNKK